MDTRTTEVVTVRRTNPLIWIIAIVAVLALVALLFDFKLTDKGALPEVAVQGWPSARSAGNRAGRDRWHYQPKRWKCRKSPLSPPTLEVAVPSVDVKLPADQK